MTDYFYPVSSGTLSAATLRHRYLHIIMRLTAALFALVIALTGVNADLVAFSGFNCQGDEGDNVACDSSCHSFGDRNSFSVLVAGPVLVSVYTDISCSVEVGNFINAGNSACNNINPGGTTIALTIQSFTCSFISTNSTVLPSTTIISAATVSQTGIASSSTPSSSTASSAGSTSTAKSSASSNKKILHWTGALLGLAAGNLMVF